MASDRAVLLPGVPPGVSAEPAYRFLSPHQAAVLDAAAHRLVPQTRDAHVMIYLDRLLSVFHVAPGQLILSQSQLASFTGLLFSHVLEAMGIEDVSGGDFRSR